MLRKTGAAEMLPGGRMLPAVAPTMPARPWEPAGRVDVERLIVWAFAVQQADRSPVAGLFEIEALADGYAWQGESSDGCARVARIGAVGTRIDGGGCARDDLMHPAAELVARVVAQHRDAELVTRWAREARRPDGWDAGGAKLAPLGYYTNGRGELLGIEERGSPDGSAAVTRWCPLIQVRGPETVKLARGRYLAWWDALDDLAWQLAAAALGFTVEGPAAEREPWAEGGG